MPGGRPSLVPRRVRAPRCPGGAQSASRPPGAIFLGWPRVCVFLVPSPRPAPPASWRRRGRLAPSRRDLYSRGGSVAAAGPEWREGGRGRRPRRSPLRYWRRCEREAREGGRARVGAGGPSAAAAAFAPWGPGWTRPPAPPPPRGPPGRGRGGRAAGAGRPLLDAGRTRDRCEPVPHLPAHAPAHARWASEVGRGCSAHKKKEESNQTEAIEMDAEMSAAQRLPTFSAGFTWPQSVFSLLKFICVVDC